MPRSIYAISAMCGCMWRESTLNPRVWESNIPADWDTMHYYNEDGYGVGGFGLGQWTNTAPGSGMRLFNMYHWCQALSLNIYEGNSQLQYLLYEDIWYNNYHVGSNAQTLTEFFETDSTDLDGLTEDFLANWEGVPGDHLAERIEHAHDILDYIREHIDDDPSTVEWQTPTDWVLPTSAILNNALCIYFFLQGYDPGPGPEKKKKMPLWMYLKRIPF